ncbi:MAG: InlB B-repeat-containing protein [Bacteroidia bacterium]
MSKSIITTFFFFLAFSCLQAQNPTWTGGIAKILYANCTSCHHTGGIAPFSLLTYQDASLNAFGIANAVTSTMPPWNADPNYKRYAHERVLSTVDINKIQQWVSNGAPSGDLRFAPPAPTYSNGSQLGTVNLSLQIPTYTITSNNDVYRNFVLPSGLSQVNFATAIEVLPGNPSIVHHVLVFQDSTNNTISTNSVGGTGSAASKLIYEYVPGAQPYYTPVGTGLRLPANTRIILQIHYAPGNSGQADNTIINFKLTTTNVRGINVNALLNHGTSLTNGPLSIPANQTRTFNESAAFPGNWTFLTASPHMHLIGRTFKTYAVKLTAPYDTIRFVNIPNWNFHWQDNFVFQNTLKIPSGYGLKATAFYDNTTNNPYNPSSPPQNVTAGESTLEEMMMVFFSYLPYQNGDENIIIDKRIIPKGATTFCDGITVTLKTIEGTGYTYQWYKNGVTISGATSASYEAGQTGNYTVSITLGPNNAVSDPVQVTVNSNPVAVITPSGSTNIPQGGSVVLNGSTGTGYTYQWYLNGSPINGATSSSYTATAAGNYELEVYNGCYAVSSVVTVSITGATYSVGTSANPVVGGTTSGSGSYVSGTNASVSATANTGYTFTNWTNNGNVVSLNPAYTFAVTGNVNLVANFTQNTVSYNVGTSANPVVGGTTSGSGSYVGGTNASVSATANTGYSFVNWTDNGNVVSSNPTYTFAVTGNVNLVANFSATIGIHPKSENTLKIYPNPSTGRIIVEANKEGDLHIFNLLGQEIQTAHLIEKQNEILIQEMGTYLLLLLDKDGNKTSGIVTINK